MSVSLITIDPVIFFGGGRLGVVAAASYYSEYSSFALPHIHITSASNLLAC